MEDLVKVDVFISYSSKNKSVADAVVSNFEQHGIRCWYAPRDIMPGKEWVTAIKEGIHSAKVFVLLFTEESNTSRQVMNEVAMAFNAEKTIVPFKLTEKEMSDELEYYLTRVHWLDAVTKPLKNHIDELRKFVELILSGSNPHATLNRKLLDDNTEENNIENNKKSKSNRKFIIAAGVAAVLVITVILILIFKPFGSGDNNTETTENNNAVIDNSKNEEEIKDTAADPDKENDKTIEDGNNTEDGSNSEVDTDNTETEYNEQAEYIAINEQGLEYFKEGDYDNALSCFLESLELGNTSTETYYCLGAIYLSGKAADGINEDKALYYLDLAYNDGNGENLTADEYYFLAYKYDSDESINNPEKACKYALKGAEAGSTDCMIMLGEAYWYGKGVEQDYNQVLNWFGKALDSGVEGYSKKYCINCITTLVEEGHATAEAASKWIGENEDSQ